MRCYAVDGEDFANHESGYGYQACRTGDYDEEVEGLLGGSGCFFSRSEVLPLYTAVVVEGCYLLMA